MPDFSNLEKAPRRDLHIFYILDTSGSMEGEPISILNRAMEETIDILKQQAKINADAQLKIAVLDFNTNCTWMQSKGPEDAEDFIWEDLYAGGLTDIANALNELNSKMSKNEFLNSTTGAYIPIVIFMTDGDATGDYKNSLDSIRKNKWFARATKIGFALGEADMKMISEIVGNSESVVKTTDLDLFSKLIKFASVTSSMMCSVSTTSTTTVTGADIIDLAKKDDSTIPDNINTTEVSYDKQEDSDWNDSDWD